MTAAIFISYENGQTSSVLNMATSDSQIDKPQRGRPKRAELPDVNINTGVQSINTERASSIRRLAVSQAILLQFDIFISRG